MTNTPNDSLAGAGAALNLLTADWYIDFAIREAHGASPTYELLSLAIAGDTELLGLLERVPAPKRQPNLLLAVVRLLGGPTDDPRVFREFTLANWPVIEAELQSRATQTNEVGRCALLVPVLASLPQPLALLEVGASAGLGLYPDRYSYRYGHHLLGTGGPVLDCELTGTAPPARLPQIVWRAGLDLNPLDVTDPADLAWLKALIWPEQRTRLERLRAAAAIATGDPPRLITGDLVDDLAQLAASAPHDATLVVFHTSVLYQVPVSRRLRFFETVRALPGHWISVEAADVVTFPRLPPPPDDTLHNVLALDGRPLAWTRSHGQEMQWVTSPDLT